MGLFGAKKNKSEEAAENQIENIVLDNGDEYQTDTIVALLSNKQ